ncbi:hypothetical protein V8C35DRAFT_293795 [Trichoderma chlorosporum]
MVADGDCYSRQSCIKTRDRNVLGMTPAITPPWTSSTPVSGILRHSVQHTPSEKGQLGHDLHSLTFVPATFKPPSLVFCCRLLTLCASIQVCRDSGITNSSDAANSRLACPGIQLAHTPTANRSKRRASPPLNPHSCSGQVGGSSSPTKGGPASFVAFVINRLRSPWACHVSRDGPNAGSVRIVQMTCRRSKFKAKVDERSQ